MASVPDGYMQDSYPNQDSSTFSSSYVRQQVERPRNYATQPQPTWPAHHTDTRNMSSNFREVDAWGTPIDVETRQTNIGLQSIPQPYQSNDPLEFQHHPYHYQQSNVTNNSSYIHPQPLSMGEYWPPQQQQETQSPTQFDTSTSQSIIHRNPHMADDGLAFADPYHSNVIVPQQEEGTFVNKQSNNEEEDIDKYFQAAGASNMQKQDDHLFGDMTQSHKPKVKSCIAENKDIMQRQNEIDDYFDENPYPQNSAMGAQYRQQLDQRPTTNRYNTSYDRRVNLQKKDDGMTISGEIQIQLSYDNINNRLFAHIKQARGLMHNRVISECSPFVKVYLLPGRSVENKWKTKHGMSTRDPSFNEVIVYKNISRDELRQKSIEFSLWNHNRGKPNDFLGEVLLDFMDDSYLDNHSHWYQLHKHNEDNMSNSLAPPAHISSTGAELSQHSFAMQLPQNQQLTATNYNKMNNNINIDVPIDNMQNINDGTQLDEQMFPTLLPPRQQYPPEMDVITERKDELYQYDSNLRPHTPIELQPSKENIRNIEDIRAITPQPNLPPSHQQARYANMGAGVNQGKKIKKRASTGTGIASSIGIKKMNPLMPSRKSGTTATGLGLPTIRSARKGGSRPTTSGSSSGRL